MSIERTLKLTGGVILVAATGLLSGCGGTETKAASPESAKASTTIATPRVAEGLRVVPVSGGELRITSEATKTSIITATPEPTKVISGQRESIVDHEMKPGEVFDAKDGSMIKGDVLVDGVRYFDDSERTGLIIELHKDAKISAPWGANVSFVGIDQDIRNAVFGQGVEEMKAKGCVNGCDRVDVVKYPGGRPQGK